MRIAAIDVGTNSIHLVVAEITASGEVGIIETGRHQVELGAGGLDANRIAPEAFERGLVALDACKAACDVLGVEDVHAAATSAVREAANGAEFCRAVKRRTGIHVRVISGKDEARLIYLGARSYLDFAPGRVLLMDLGGGSTEFILCDRDEAQVLWSLPLGHIRLADKHHHSDPLSTSDANAMRDAVRAGMQPIRERVTRKDFATMVGTSGTMRCLARMATLRRGDLLPEHGHGLVATRDDIEHFYELFQKLPQRDLDKIPGMDPKRRRTLPAGLVLVREAMKAWRVERFLTSERSLRDGLLIDWVMRHRPELALSATVQDPRRRAIAALLERYGADRAHGELVRTFALALFDATARVHQLATTDRELLAYAAEIHDIGHHISGQDHNKHGQYLIRHTRMPGFTAPEVELLGNLVRYHRGSEPKATHPELEGLSRPDRRRLRVLAAMLRVADALDRSHNQLVEHIDVLLGADHLLITARARDDAHLERWATVQRADLLESVLHRKLVLQFERAASG